MRPATEHTILICDDDPDILAALRIYLTGEGYQVVSAWRQISDFDHSVARKCEVISRKPF